MAPQASKHDDCPFKDVVFPEKYASAESDHRMDTRVGRLEGVVESLTRDIQEVSQNINMMGKEMGSFREVIGETLTRMREGFTAQIESVTDRLTTSSKPQWQSIFAFVAMGLTVLGMAGAVVGMLFSGQASNVTRLQNDTAIITDRMFSAQYEKGKADAFSAETSSHLSKLDATLQREMTLMQQTTDSKIIAVDKNVNDYIEKVQDALKDFRNWRLEHATKGAEADASLIAKQEMLIEQMRIINDRLDRTEHRPQDDISVKK
jgi:gas vesicle protein